MKKSNGRKTWRVRYRKLNALNKFFVWAAIASFVSFAFYVLDLLINLSRLISTVMVVLIEFSQKALYFHPYMLSIWLSIVLFLAGLVALKPFREWTFREKNSVKRMVKLMLVPAGGFFAASLFISVCLTGLPPVSKVIVVAEFGTERDCEGYKEFSHILTDKLRRSFEYDQTIQICIRRVPLRLTKHADARIIGRNIRAIAVVWGYARRVENDYHISPNFTVVPATGGLFRSANLPEVIIPSTEISLGLAKYAGHLSVEIVTLTAFLSTITDSVLPGEHPMAEPGLFAFLKSGHQSSIFQNLVYRALAHTYYQQNLYELAAEVYKRASQEDSSDVFSLHGRGVCLLRMCKYSEAGALFRQAVLTAPSDIESSLLSKFWADLGSAYAYRKMYLQAQMAYESALSIDTNCILGHVGKGMVFHKLGNDKAALKCYEKAIRINRKSPLGYGYKADLLRSKGETEGALSFCEKALSFDSNYDPAYDTKGVVLAMSKNYDLALRFHDKAISLAPRKPAYHFNKACTLCMHKKYPEALQEIALTIQYDDGFKELIMTDPCLDKLRTNKVFARQLHYLMTARGQFPSSLAFDLQLQIIGETVVDDAITNSPHEIMFERAKTFIKEGNWSGAIVELETLTQTIKQPGLYNMLGIAYMMLGNGERAMASLKRALLLSDSADESIWSNFGAVCLKTGNVSLGIDLLEGFCLEHLDYLVARHTLGNLYQKAGDLEKATECFEYIVDRNPKDIAALNSLGLAYCKQNKYQEAIFSYKKAIALNPGFRLVHKNLASCMLKYAWNYLKDREYDKAMPLLSEALEHDPTLVEAHGGLGLIYSENGRTKKAIEEYKKEILINPNNAVVRNRLGILYLEQNRFEEAKYEFKKAAELDLPKKSLYLHNLATALLEEGNYKEAEQILLDCIAATPADQKNNLAILHCTLGKTYEMMERFSEALSEYKDCIELGHAGSRAVGDAEIGIDRIKNRKLD